MKNLIKKSTKKAVVIAAIAIVVLANFFINPFSWRIDASQGHAYTLSPATKKVLQKINKSVSIKFYVSSDIPTRLLPLKQNVVDLLEEYKKANGKIQVSILDPKSDQKIAAEAQSAGIPQLQFSQLEQDKYAITSSYFGIALSSNGRNEVVPQATDISSLEYNLTAAIYKLTHTTIANIGIVGAPNLSLQGQDPIGTVRNILNQQFELTNVDLASSSATQNVKTVMIFDDNQKQYTNDEIANLKTYLKQGGKAVVFADGEWIQQDTLTASNAQHNLGALFADYGITLHNDLVLSTAAELINFGNGGVTYLSPYPFWLKTNVFNNKSPYFSNVSQLTFPWTSALTLGKKSGVQADYLVKTTKSSWEQKNTFTLNPQEIANPQSKDLKQFIIAAQARNSKGGTLVVIPSSRFIQDQYLSQQSDNVGFVLNILNDFASAGALSGIRSRQANTYPLPDIPESQKETFKYINILLLPALFGIYGAWRLIKRK